MTVPGAAAEYPHVLSLCNSLGTTVDTKQGPDSIEKKLA